MPAQESIPASDRSPNPALRSLLQAFPASFAFIQCLVSPGSAGYELRHVADREAPSSELRPLAVDQLRAWSQVAASGVFRPLKGAPDLRPGWVVTGLSVDELDRALEMLYPGALADWHHFTTREGGATSFEAYMGRQTGMYRSTKNLPAKDAAHVIDACCTAAFCLKRRIWSVGDFPADGPEHKSIVPCLEPCAVMLELARKAQRITQEEPVSLQLAPSDWETIKHALETALVSPIGRLRVGDVASPSNPRRLQLLLNRLNEALPCEDKTGESH